MRHRLEMSNEDIYTVLMNYLREQFKVPATYEKKLEKPIPPRDPYYPPKKYATIKVPLVFTTTIDGQEYVVDNIKAMYDSDPENNS